MRFLKMTTQSDKPVLLNPDHIRTVAVKDSGDENVLLGVWCTGSENMSYYKPVDEVGQVLSKAAIEVDITKWGHEVLLERFESYVRSRT
ncbi:MAG: hypothetical protein ACTIID_03310 [Brevibacterium linens]